MRLLTIRLITYLSREDSVNSLLHWVTSGLDELDEQAARAEDKAFRKALASKDVFPEFKVEGGDSGSTSTTEKGKSGDESDPVSPGMGIGLGEGLEPVEETNIDNSRAK